MKTKLIIAIFTIQILIGGCSSSESGSSSGECMDCQRLKDVLRYFRDEEHAEKIILAEFKTEYGHQAGSEMPWEDFEKIILQSAGCCAPYHLSEEWEEYNWLDCIREYLEEENVQRIAFYEGIHFKAKPEDWNSPWAVITEPEKINEMLKLLHEALGEDKDRFANEGIVVGHAGQMQIITDKHKFIIPIAGNSREDEAIRGLGWSSCKLRKKLTDWGLAEPVPEEKDRILRCVWENLEKENIQRINFCQYVLGEKVNKRGRAYLSLECHPCGEISAPQKINEVLELLHEGLKRGANSIEEGETYDKVRMQVVTDKHKYFIRIFLDKEAVCGIGWTSYELRKKLAEWGIPELE